MFNIKYILIYITLLGMEISWLYALFNAANKSVSERLSIPLLMVTLLISFGVSAALRYLRWPKLALTALSWLAWPVIMLLMVKVQLFPGISFTDTTWLGSIPHAFSQIFYAFEPALLILLATAVLWWLGRRLAYVKPDFAASVTEFQFGLIILMMTFFTAYELNLEQSSSLPITMTFFALGLFGISVSHAQDNHSWLHSWRSGHWSTMLIFSIVVILLLGLLISIIVTPDLLNLFLQALKWVWSQIERFMVFLANLFPQPSDSQAPLPSVPGIPEVPETEGSGFQLPEWLTRGGRIAWIILFVGMVLLAVWRIASQILSMMRRRAAGAGGEIESLKGAFRRDFINWLKRIVSLIFRIKFGSQGKDRLKNVPPEIASVRQLYTQFLRWTAERGYPRKKWQTPAEFQFVINGNITQNQEALDFITREYMNARYGSALPTEDELEQLKQKWNNLKQTDINIPGQKENQKRG